MIDCYSCREKEKLRPGMDYASSPCSTCRLSRNSTHEYSRISGPSDAGKLISFFKRTRFVMRHSARREILYLLLRNPRATDREIAECFRISRRKASYHVRVIKRSIPEIFGVHYYAGHIK